MPGRYERGSYRIGLEHVLSRVATWRHSAASRVRSDVARALGTCVNTVHQHSIRQYMLMRFLCAFLVSWSVIVCFISHTFSRQNRPTPS